MAGRATRIETILELSFHISNSIFLLHSPKLSNRSKRFAFFSTAVSWAAMWSLYGAYACPFHHEKLLIETSINNRTPY